MSEAIEKQLKSISDTMGWCAFWLFFIMLNTCNTNYNTDKTVEAVNSIVVTGVEYE